MTRTNEELAVLIKDGKTELYTELWENCKDLISLIAHKHFTVNYDRCISAGVTVDDIIQSGYFALIEAVKYFDTESGYKFVTYLNLPLKRQINTLLGYTSSYRDSLDYSTSLDVPINDDIGERTLGDTIIDEDSELPFINVENNIFNTQLKAALNSAIETLPERERPVITDFYFNNLSLREIKRRSDGLSYPQVNSAYNRAISKLRRNHLEALQPFADEILSRALKCTGYSAFINNGASSVELTAEMIEERYKTMLLSKSKA